MDERKLIDEKEQLHSSLSSFLKSLKDPETNKDVLFYQFEPNFPVFLTGDDMKNSSVVKNFSKIFDPSELASLLLNGVVVNGMSNTKEEKETLRVFEHMTEKMKELESQFHRTLRELKNRMTVTFFTHSHVNEFLIDNFNGNLNDAKKVKKNLEQMRGVIHSLNKNNLVDEKRVRDFLDKTTQIRLELQRLVESITPKIKDKVVRFEKPNTQLEPKQRH